MACMASTVCEGKRWNNCVLQSGHMVSVFHGGGGEEQVVVLEGSKCLNLHFFLRTAAAHLLHLDAPHGAADIDDEHDVLRKR